MIDKSLTEREWQDLVKYLDLSLKLNTEHDVKGTINNCIENIVQIKEVTKNCYKAKPLKIQIAELESHTPYTQLCRENQLLISRIAFYMTRQVQDANELHPSQFYIACEVALTRLKAQIPKRGAPKNDTHKNITLLILQLWCKIGETNLSTYHNEESTAPLVNFTYTLLGFLGYKRAKDTIRKNLTKAKTIMNN